MYKYIVLRVVQASGKISTDFAVFPPRLPNSISATRNGKNNEFYVLFVEMDLRLCAFNRHVGQLPFCVVVCSTVIRHFIYVSGMRGWPTTLLPSALG